MAKQTAAAQKRTEAEARKAARAVAIPAAASNEAALGAGSHASKATAKEVRTTSGMSLAGTSAAAAVAAAGQSAGGSQAGLHVDADLATATAGSSRPQLAVCSIGNASKPIAAGASTGQDENQASNAAAGGTGQLMTSSHSSQAQAGSGKAKPGKKRAAEALEAGDGPRGGHSRSTKSKTGA